MRTQKAAQVPEGSSISEFTQVNGELLLCGPYFLAPWKRGSAEDHGNLGIIDIQ